jgi:diphthine-ammonia ligase
MASSLNVIALVSGGKDSLFSILHCQANGHTIVALANLHPAMEIANDEEDIDSYMYQTVGHAVIPLYEQALAIPLYRQEITGSAVNSSRDYEKSTEQEEDETENLVPLLAKVMKAHPEANALSTGAILSTYQRTRVESVALRLGLTPLSYLWQYPLLPPYTQSSLLHDMAAVGQEAVIVKTASGGLDESFLGLDVANQKTIAKLSKTMARFGEAGNGAIVGEGGEFETLALDGPSALWKRRIVIEDASPVAVAGGQTVLNIKESRLEDKRRDEIGGEGDLRIPELFDEEFKKMLDATIDDDRAQTSSAAVEISSTNPTHLSLVPQETPSSTHLPTNIFNNTSTLFTSSNLTTPTPYTSPSRQLASTLLRLSHILIQSDLHVSQINHCTLVLRHMSDFPILNPIYAQFFSAINPPARVTIAAGSALPVGIDVMLSVVLDKDNSTSRQGLHVQGRSYWAPANIGPYSQAISVPLPRSSQGGDGDGDGIDSGEIVYIAGQIPLHPASMAVYSTHGFGGQVLLSLQHLWRIGRAKGVRWWAAGVGFVPASVDNVDVCVKVAQDAWKQIHAIKKDDDDDDFGDENEDGEGENHDVDPWDRINTSMGNAFNDTTYRAPIPDRSAILSDDTSPIPPCFIAQIASLPRDVNIEWSATGLTSPSIRFSNTTSSPRCSRSVFLTREITQQSDLKMDAWTSATLYAGRGFESAVTWNMSGVQWIPCIRVWGSEGKEVQGVIVGRIDTEME